jgi:hypothetical protein
MHLAGFFRLVWTLQLLVGVALFGVSFLIESRILTAFFAAPILAWALALALEIGKAVTIVFHRHLRQSQSEQYSLSIRLVSGTFRVGLIGLSLMCSLLFLGVQLDRPHIQELRQAGLAAIDARLSEDLARLDDDYKARAKARRERMIGELADVRAEHDRRIRDLERMLAAEMDNQVSGQFKGPRYREIAARLGHAQAERERILAALVQRQAKESAALATTSASEYRQARAARRTQAESERHTLQSASFDDDERVHDPRVVAFLRLADSLLDLQLTASQFVFGVSAFLSLLMELGILLAFETLVLTLGPALTVQQREAVMSEALLAEVAGTAERDAIRHDEAMERVRKGAERVVERARAHAEAV